MPGFALVGRALIFDAGKTIDNTSSREDDTIHLLRKMYRPGRTRYDEPGPERSSVPDRARDADGCRVPALLAADLHVRPCAGAGRRAALRAAAGRELRRLPQWRGPGRRARRALPASRRVTDPGPRRGLRHSLHLS